MNNNYNKIALEGEEFREVDGYSGKYYVSNYGRIWSTVGKGRLLKQSKSPNGYLKIGLSKNGIVADYYVHRLVAIAFVPNPDNKLEVNHLNENKTDNRAVNMNWVSHIENINYGTRTERARINKSKAVICVETGVVYSSIKEAQEQTHIDGSTISKVCQGKNKSAGGYHWEYVKF